jgi:hypothetical protein
LQRFHAFNLHDKNTDINFNYHFEPNKGWLEVFLNSKKGINLIVQKKFNYKKIKL